MTHEQRLALARTKTGRQKLARMSREYGFHAHQVINENGGKTSKLYVRCPLCAERVECDDRRYRIENSLADLDAAVIDHLEGYCKEIHGDTTIAGPDGA